MSNGCVIPGTPIAVDHWHSTCGGRLYFLSHCHLDHMQGLTPTWSRMLYCSPVTKQILIKRFKFNPFHIHALEVNQSHIISLDNENQVTMSVTLIDANHCPGAVMFLFESYFGRILYTGDFRYKPDMFLHNHPMLHNVDVLYLDNTYCRPACDFPTKKEAEEQIISIISDIELPCQVHIGVRTLGKEDLLVNIARHFQTRICVPGNLYESLQILEMPDVFTTNPAQTWLHTYPLMQITKKRLAALNKYHRTQAILPTALYTGLPNCDTSVIHGDHISVVPYSDHSSYSELLQFVSMVSPKIVRPIVKGDARGPFGTSLHERADMSVFDTYLSTQPMCVDDEIPISVVRFMQRPYQQIEMPHPIRRHKKNPREKSTTPAPRKKSKAKGVVFESPEKVQPSQGKDVSNDGESSEQMELEIKDEIMQEEIMQHFVHKTNRGQGPSPNNEENNFSSLQMTSDLTSSVCLLGNTSQLLLTSNEAECKQEREEAEQDESPTGVDANHEKSASCESNMILGSPTATPKTASSPTLQQSNSADPEVAVLDKQTDLLTSKEKLLTETSKYCSQYSRQQQHHISEEGDLPFTVPITSWAWQKETSMEGNFSPIIASKKETEHTIDTYATSASPSSTSLPPTVTNSMLTDCRVVLTRISPESMPSVSGTSFSESNLSGIRETGCSTSDEGGGLEQESLIHTPSAETLDASQSSRAFLKSDSEMKRWLRDKHFTEKATRCERAHKVKQNRKDPHNSKQKSPESSKKHNCKRKKNPLEVYDFNEIDEAGNEYQKKKKGGKTLNMGENKHVNMTKNWYVRQIGGIKIQIHSHLNVTEPQGRPSCHSSSAKKSKRYYSRGSKGEQKHHRATNKRIVKQSNASTQYEVPREPQTETIMSVSDVSAIIEKAEVDSRGTDASVQTICEANVPPCDQTGISEVDMDCISENESNVLAYDKLSNTCEQPNRSVQEDQVSANDKVSLDQEPDELCQIVDAICSKRRPRSSQGSLNKAKAWRAPSVKTTPHFQKKNYRQFTSVIPVRKNKA